MQDFNPKLHAWDRQLPDDRAGYGGFETYGTIENLPWQSRSRAPTAYENRLADGLESAFKGGAKDLAALVDSLNTQGALRSDGMAWTEQRLAAELETLGR